MLQRQLCRRLLTLPCSLSDLSPAQILRTCEPRWHAQPFSEAAAAEAGGLPFSFHGSTVMNTAHGTDAKAVV